MLRQLALLLALYQQGICDILENSAVPDSPEGIIPCEDTSSVGSLEVLTHEESPIAITDSDINSSSIEMDVGSDKSLPLVREAAEDDEVQGKGMGTPELLPSPRAGNAANKAGAICSVTDGDGRTYKGTCVSSCSILNGGTQLLSLTSGVSQANYSSPGQGDCAFGLECCLNIGSCSDSSSAKITHFNSKLNLPSSCTFTVRVFSKYVTQMRLDFLQFELLPATQTITTAAFTCNFDYAVVNTAKKNSLPILCGYNTDQHAYFAVNASDGDTTLTITINTVARPVTIGGNPFTNNARWKIEIIQIESGQKSASRSLAPQQFDRMWRAPEGVLQYFINPTGTIRSFNYNPNLALAHNHYVANQDYTICFKRTDKTCGFELYGGNFGLGSNDVTCQAMNAFQDYLFLGPALFTKGAAAATPVYIYCSDRLDTNTASAVVKTPGPYCIDFHADNVYTSPFLSPQTENGFNLNYAVPPRAGC